MLKNVKRSALGVSLGLLAAVFAAGPIASAVAATVTPNNTQGWSTADTRPGGSVSFYKDNDAPQGEGALQLTTNSSGGAKAQYMHAAESDTKLSTITDLSYWTKQIDGPAVANASFQLPVDVNGGTLADGGFTTFVFETYQNGTITKGNWQSWDVDAGQMWSTRNASCIGANFQAGGGGDPFYSLENIKASCPDAVVLGYGVNVGSNNPSYKVATDLLVVNDMNYDFEYQNLAYKDACKQDGWKNVYGASYKNQGQCVSQFASQDDNASSATVADYPLNSANQDGVDVATKKDGWYLVTVTGTWNNRGGEVVDAECTSWQNGPWTNDVNGDYSSDLLDVQIGERFVNWGGCDSADHSYTKLVKASGDKLNLRVFDGDVGEKTQNTGWFDDNNGILNVRVTSY
jgi:hypothetical protein